MNPGDRVVDSANPDRRGVIQTVDRTHAHVRWRRGNETDIAVDQVHTDPGRVTGYLLLDEDDQ